MVALLGFFVYFKGRIFADFKNISLQKAHTLLAKSDNIVLLDVRSKKEFEKDYLKGTIHIYRKI